MGRLSYILLISMGLLMSACSIKGEIEEVLIDPLQVMVKSSSNEFNSGALVQTTTSGGYKVGHSVGQIHSKMYSVTPENGYQVYLTVQGTVFSESD